MIAIPWPPPMQAEPIPSLPFLLLNNTNYDYKICFTKQIHLFDQNYFHITTNLSAMI